jgi:uncharacterized protein (DUF885 family)
VTIFRSFPLGLLIACAAPVTVVPAVQQAQELPSDEEAQTLAVLKAQQMIAVCNQEPSSAACYALAIAYYTGRTQTPEGLMERVRDSQTECARRCAADLGLHVFGWTRDEAIARTKLEAKAIDALLAWPGEALSCLDSQGKNENNPLLGD